MTTPADGAPWFPSNASEGEFFQARVCSQCVKWDGCSILAASYWKKRGEGVRQWQYREGLPTCTAFATERVRRGPRVSKQQLKLEEVQP